LISMPLRGRVVVVFGLVCALASARVGETRRACDVRYGEPLRVSDSGSLVTYKSRGQSVVIHFAAGVADMVSHTKLPAIAGESPVPFNNAQLEDILKNNGGIRVWVREKERPSGAAWRTEDGVLHAALNRAGTQIMVYTPAFAAAGTADTL
jgi:hypothetical protein